jgi:spore germination cell wall hydrolase CwlJ-like protein
MVPNTIGHQDLASLIARQPGVAERGRAHVRAATTLTTLHTATFSFPRPLGSAIPDAPGYQFASLDPRALDIPGSARTSDPFYDPFAERATPPAPTYVFPSVERRLKGDMLVRRKEQAPLPKAKPQQHKEQETQRERAAAAPPPVQAVPVWSGQEPFAIPQKLIVEGERIQARREAAVRQAARAAMLAIRIPAQAEPFTVAAGEIAAAERIEAQRLAAARLAQAPAAPVAQVEVQSWAQPEAEPFEIAEDLIAEAERIAAARLEMARNAAQEEEAATADAAAATVPEAAPETVTIAEAGTGIPLVENDRILTDEDPREEDAAAAPQAANPAVEMAKLYFGADSFSAAHGGLETYAPGEAPTLLAPGKAADPDIKLSVQTPSAPVEDEAAEAEAEPKDVEPKAVESKDVESKEAESKEAESKEAESKTGAAPRAGDGKGKDIEKKDGEKKDGGKTPQANTTIAAKGEVTGEGRRPRTPAERLNLSGATRAKHERCLANAIYFEARGEYERGQMAVAQVVMNRVFSPYYPESVCGVVYQNAHKHLACQFTFACDNVRDVVTEPEAWETAKRIARDTLDGKLWLPEIGKATHYHATYVNPWWVRTMHKYKTLGVHIFYRPKRWGDGADEPTWDPAVLDVTGSIKAPDKSRATAFNK